MIYTLNHLLHLLNQIIYFGLDHEIYHYLQIKIYYLNNQKSSYFIIKSINSMLINHSPIKI